jgi:hypothetical protein
VNLNPFGFGVWSYAVGIANDPEVTRTIVEWQPPTLRTTPGIAFFASVAAVLLLLARRGRSVQWPVLLQLGVFFFVGLYAVRGVFWWGLAMPPLVAGMMSEAPPRRIEEPRTSLNNAIAAMLALIGVALLPWWRAPSATSTALLTDSPPGVTRALSSALRPGDRIFNPQIWGSWFEFALPENPVFVDARIEIFPSSVWRDYDSVSGAIDGWQQILDRWGVAAVVADRRQQARVIPWIRRDPAWRLVHEDAQGLVFVRSGDGRGS